MPGFIPRSRKRWNALSLFTKENEANGDDEDGNYSNGLWCEFKVWRNGCRDRCVFARCKVHRAVLMKLPHCWDVASCRLTCRYTLSNKNPSAWDFLSPGPEEMCGTVAIIIRVVILSPYLRSRGVSLSFIHYSQSHRAYINRRRQYICLIWNQNINSISLTFPGVRLAS